MVVGGSIGGTMVGMVGMVVVGGGGGGRGEGMVGAEMAEHGQGQRKGKQKSELDQSKERGE